MPERGPCLGYRRQGAENGHQSPRRGRVSIQRTLRRSILMTATVCGFGTVGLDFLDMVSLHLEPDATGPRRGAPERKAERNASHMTPCGREGSDKRDDTAGHRPGRPDRDGDGRAVLRRGESGSPGEAIPKGGGVRIPRRRRGHAESDPEVRVDQVSVVGADLRPPRWPRCSLTEPGVEGLPQLALSARRVLTIERLKVRARCALTPRHADPQINVFVCLSINHVHRVRLPTA